MTGMKYSPAAFSEKSRQLERLDVRLEERPLRVRAETRLLDVGAPMRRG